jgi:hypothetical protein
MEPDRADRRRDFWAPSLNRIVSPGDQPLSGREPAHQEGTMTVLRDMLANELPTAIYFCGTTVMLAVYGVCALSLRRPAPALTIAR